MQRGPLVVLFGWWYQSTLWLVSRQVRDRKPNPAMSGELLVCKFRCNQVILIPDVEMRLDVEVVVLLRPELARYPDRCTVII